VPIRLPFRPRPDSSRSDLWTKCSGCSEMIYNKQLKSNLRVCPKCGHHFRLRVDMRLGILLDHDSFEEQDAGLESLDPLGFVDLKAYPDRVAEQKEKTGIRDAAVWGYGAIEGTRISICAMDFAYMGGSMGSVVGEKFSRAGQECIRMRAPLVCFSATGGARMQEGLLSLMQMAKTSAVLGRMAEEGIPYISVLTHPTTGGVSASLGMLGDVNIAEPGALIGFAGPRVIEQTVREKLPEGFQRSEFLLEKGAVDMIVDRRQLRDEISALLRLLTGGKRPRMVSGELLTS